MDANLLQAIFTDETKAREWLESSVWPSGPVCPHCGADREKITGLRGKAHRPGLYQCKACREQFTIKVKTVFEKSKIPLSKWLMALFLMTASKKGISGHQVHRMLGISYKSTWFMCHRLRKAMRSAKYPPLGGLEEAVEVDETYIGRQSGGPQKLKGSRQAGHRPVGPSGCLRAFVPHQDGELTPHERALGQAGIEEVLLDSGPLKHLSQDRQEIPGPRKRRSFNREYVRGDAHSRMVKV